MHKSLLWILFVLVAAGCNQPAEYTEEAAPAAKPAAETEASQPDAAQSSKRGKAEAKIADADISIDYGRPELKGRDMISQASPGMVWRLGMDEATEMTSSKPLSFGGKVVPAGTHTLFSKYVGPGKWELTVNSETGLWGAFEHNPAKDVANIPLAEATAEPAVDKFLIEVKKTGDRSGELVFTWGTKVLSAPFQVQ